MKNLKNLQTSALALVLALGTFSANAGTYDGSDTLTISVTTAAALTVEFDDADDVLTFIDMVDGDNISATTNVDITGADRSITCLFTGGMNQGGSTTATTGTTFDLKDGNLLAGATVATITMDLDACDVAENHVITITSSDLAGTTPSFAYDTTGDQTPITLTVSYDINDTVASYT